MMTDEIADLDREFDPQLSLHIGRVVLAASECEDILLELLSVTYQVDEGYKNSVDVIPPNPWRTGAALTDALEKRLPRDWSHIALRYRELSEKRNAIVHSSWIGNGHWPIGFRRRNEGYEVRSKVSLEALDLLAADFLKFRQDVDSLISILLGIR